MCIKNKFADAVCVMWRTWNYSLKENRCWKGGVEDILGKYIFKNSEGKAELAAGGKKEHSTSRRSQASNR